MTTDIKEKHVWIWIHEHSFLKAVLNQTDMILTIYNVDDEILIRRTRITNDLLQKMEMRLLALGAKRIDNRTIPFIYL